MYAKFSVRLSKRKGTLSPVAEKNYGLFPSEKLDACYTVVYA